jgi:serine/threonine protein kinase
MSKVFTITEGLLNLGALRSGGQGSVYKGQRTGTIYSAIKLIPTPIHTEDENDKNYLNFKNEVAKLQKVNENPSPNVVKILSWGITDSGSFPFIEMEYIEGPDLSELLHPSQQQPFKLKELVKVADQLANALAHCHKVGVKHGDIKSNNVKYNVHTGNYVLLDFGLAIMSDEQRRTSIRHAGAIEFMAPEQHEGKMLLQTDVYSYGIILFELLTGQVPFPLQSDGDVGRNAVMLGHLEGEIPDAMSLRKQHLSAQLSAEELDAELRVPSWLLSVIDKCLKKDPNERYANGMEIDHAVTNGILLMEHYQLHSRTSDTAQMAISASIQQKGEEIAVLQKELAKLKTLAGAAGITYNKITHSFEKGDNVHLPKRTLIVSALAIVVLFVFGLAFNPFKKEAASQSATYDAEPLFLTYNKAYFQQLKEAREDSLAMAKVRLAEKTKAVEEVNKQQNGKKKRKKFLGIF